METAEEINTMEYMVENLMKRIDENKDNQDGPDLGPTVVTPIVTFSLPSQLEMTASSQHLEYSTSNSIDTMGSHSGDLRRQSSLNENIEKLKKVYICRFCRIYKYHPYKVQMMITLCFFK